MGLTVAVLAHADGGRAAVETCGGVVGRSLLIVEEAGSQGGSENGPGRRIPWDRGAGEPWGRAAQRASGGGDLLLLYPDETFSVEGDTTIDAPAVSLVAVEIARSGASPFETIVELQPRLLRGGADTRWGPDGLPLVLDAPVATGITISGPRRRWTRPGDFLDLVVDEAGSAADTPLTLSYATAMAQRGELRAARSALDLAMSWLDGGDRLSASVVDAAVALAEGLAIAGNAEGVLAMAAQYGGVPEIACVAGRLLVELGRDDEAEEWFLAALRSEQPRGGTFRGSAPGSWPAWELGDIAFRQGRHGDAAAWTRRAMAGTPESPVGWARLALALDAAGDDAGAQEAMDRAVACALPMPAPAWESPAGAVYSLCVAAGDYRGAVHAARHEIERGTPVFRQRAAALHRLGLDEQAADDLWTHLALRPTDAGAAALLGRCSRSVGAGRDAVLAWQYALQLAPNDPEALAGLAEALLDEGNLAGALDHARALGGAASDDRDAGRIVARVQLAAGEAQEAYERLVALVAQHPSSTACRTALMELLLDAEEPALAASVGSSGCERDDLDTADAPMLLLLAEALGRAGQLTDSTRAADLALLLSPSLREAGPGPTVAGDPVEAGRAPIATSAEAPVAEPSAGIARLVAELDGQGEAAGNVEHGTTSKMLNVGCGDVKYPGWLNVDIIPTADVVVDVTQGLPWADATFERIYNEHFIEHLTVEQGLAFLRECHRVLTPGGVLRMATPDLDFLVQRAAGDWRDQDWLSWPQFGFIQTRAEMMNISFRWWGHQYLYDEEELGRRLVEAGFKVWRRVPWGESGYPALRGLETRKDSNLVVEAVRTQSTSGR